MELCYNIIFYFCNGIYGWHLKCGWNHDLLPSPQKSLKSNLYCPQTNPGVTTKFTFVFLYYRYYACCFPHPNLRSCKFYCQFILFSNKNVNLSMLVRIKPLKYTFFFYNTLLRLLDYLKVCQLFYILKIFF